MPGMRGYPMPLATPARSSFVPTLPRSRYADLEPAVSESLAGGLGPPVGAAINGATRAKAFQYARGAVTEVDGRQRGLAAAIRREALVMTLDRGVIVDDELFPWDGAQSRSIDPTAPRGRALVAAPFGSMWMSVRQNTAETTIDIVSIRRVSLEGPPTPRVRQESGYGTAAISHDGAVALSMSNGRFVVIDPAELETRLELRHEYPSYLVTAGAAGWLLVTAEPNTDQSTPPVERRARVTGLPGYHFRGQWRTRVRHLGADGRQGWDAEVPFPVLQPPVCAGGPRCYLVGKGLAALDAGRMVWHKPANMRLHATCFGDGSVAVTAGFTLRILTRSGDTRQTLTVPDRSRILTLPAVGPDGALYVGTVTGFWVARGLPTAEIPVFKSSPSAP